MRCEGAGGARRSDSGNKSSHFSSRGAASVPAALFALDSGFGGSSACDRQGSSEPSSSPNNTERFISFPLQSNRQAVGERAPIRLPGRNRSGERRGQQEAAQNREIGERPGGPLQHQSVRVL